MVGGAQSGRIDELLRMLIFSSCLGDELTRFVAGCVIALFLESGSRRFSSSKKIGRTPKIEFRSTLGVHAPNFNVC